MNNMDDSISRQDALDAITRVGLLKKETKEVLAVSECLRKVEKLPSFDLPERVGHWVIMGNRYIKCSECGHITKTESPDIYNFCMVCGAKMSESEDKE